MKPHSLGAFLAGLILMTTLAVADGRYNVLFISVDDLRPELGCYGSTAVPTPHMDRLAGEGMLFERAYCQEAICMASRASLLSGLYPVARNGYNFRTRVDEGLPDVTCLPGFFKENGYHTVGINKDFHHFWFEQKNWDEHYSSPTPGSDWRNYITAENKGIQQARFAEAIELHGDNHRYNPDNLPSARSFEIGPDALSDQYIDSHGTALAIEKLRELRDKRFFLALGFRKPHLPFNAPRKFYDQFPLEEIALPDNRYPPEGASAYAFMDSFELRAYTDIPDEGPAVPNDTRARELLRGYYACVAYVDDLVGQVLDELERLGLRENTVVVLWGDHGFKLGEHNEWGKHANFEVDLRSPLILSVPGGGFQPGRTAALTEFVDLYPTLVELCGLDTPPHLEGKSLVPLLSGEDPVHREYAFSQYPRDEYIMGYSVKTDAFRYTEWIDLRDGTALGRELFDHRVDPMENRNVADQPEQAAELARLRQFISAKLESVSQRRQHIPTP